MGLSPDIPNPYLSVEEVENVKQWAIENEMTLNFSKTWEMIVRGKTRKTLPQQLPQINRKSELTLLGVTLNEDPNNWDTHFDMMLHKASSR